MTNVAIFGGYSAIAEATARELAGWRCQFFLIGRDRGKLDQVAADLKVRGAEEVHVFVSDLAEPAGIQASIDALYDTFDTVEVALLAHGTLPDQKACEADASQTLAALEINALSHIVLLTLLAERFAQQDTGTIAVVTSVAGDRGRKSNYVYGTAKRAVSTFLDGVRHRLAATNVNVIDIRPGFVDTPMTAEFDKGALWALPAKVGSDIVRAIEKGRPVVYTPWFWRYIMAIIRNVPAFVFHKTNL
ncbi:MAG: SDR family oxidoreductase [Alphaproteobacteria bacterium]|nr:SDR family oxidoreductase [Alphaproteobacteria bacterium]